MADDALESVDAERVLDAVATLLAADSLEHALVQAARLFGSRTHSFVTAIFAIEHGRIVAEAWSPDDTARRGRLRPHLRRLTLESTEARTPVETPFPGHVTTGLVPHVLLLRSGERTVGTVCCACLPSPDLDESSLRSAVGSLVPILAHKIGALFDAGAVGTARAQYERWFRQLDSHIRVLDRERQKFAALVNRSDTCVFVADAAGVINWANRAMAVCAPTDEPNRGWVGRQCREACTRFDRHGCGVEPGACQVARATASDRVAHAEFRRAESGGTRNFYSTACPIKGVEGRTQEVIVTVQDLSDLGTIKRSETRLRMLFERGANAIVMVDPAAHRIVLANPMAGRLLGMPSEELSDHAISEFFDASAWSELSDRLRAIPSDQTLRISEQRLRPAIGEERIANLIAGRFDLAGEAVILIELDDVTERHRAEQALREAETQVKTVLSNSPIVLFALDRNGVFTLSEGRGLAALGLAPGEVVGQSAEDLYRDAPQVLANVRRALGGEEFSAVVDVGALKFETRYAPLHDASGAISGVIGVATDVTELRALEEQLRQTWKMEALGRLAGGVAHDFNNLLTVIIGRTQLVLGQLGPEHMARPSVEEVHKAGVCATLLTRQLLAFSRREMVNLQLLDLCALVADIESMLTRLIGEDVTLVTRFDDGSAWVKADRSQMEQVVLNLVVNARDAMPNGGRLEIRIGHADESDEVVMTLIDTGSGMDAATRSRLFEPFFTTKTRERGTGLGLSLVQGIVQASSGRIEVESEPGFGTTVTIRLPNVQEGRRPERPTVAASGPRGHETVLLVEDEAAVRLLAREVLHAGGYSVLEAENGVEALEVASRHVGPIHLLITDVVMPRMGGGELVRRLEAIRPEVRVLYVSGYTDDTVVRNGVQSESAAFIQKPFALEDFSRKVRATLDTAASRPEGRAAA